MQIKSIFPENSNITSQYCKYFYRCEQSSGEISNLVAGKDPATKNAGFLDATLWANSGYATIGNGSGNYCTIPPATHDLTLNGYSLILTCRVKKNTVAFPGAEQYFISSYQPGVSDGGIIMSCRTNGAVGFYARTADGSATIGGQTTANVLTDGANANERSIVVMYPRETSVHAFIGVDGVPNVDYAATNSAGKSLAGGRNMQIGVPIGGGTIAAYQIAAFAAYQIPVDGASLNLSLINDWAYRNPGVPMPDWVFA